MSKAEIHADIRVEGILGRGRTKCTEPEVGTGLAGLRQQSSQQTRWSRRSAGIGVSQGVS